MLREKNANVFNSRVGVYPQMLDEKIFFEYCAPCAYWNCAPCAL